MSSALENVRADDFVEYFIYPLAAEPCSSEKLSELHNKLISFVSQWTENYFWHRDKFNLNKVFNTQPEDDCSHFHGIVHFGENIDDEWFVVYLIKKISENFDVVARVVDSDGEFLLIEASDYLAKWMNPESCDRRVYLHRGIIRIIPTDVLPKIVQMKPVMIYFYVNNSYSVTEIEKNITNCINGRIEKYPENLQDLLHRSRVYLPAKIAALLIAKPDLISAAITAFFQRDVIDMKVCRKMEHFPPENLVRRLVTFTKFSFAMISQDKGNPDRKRWNLPPPTDPQYKEYLLGYKITSGFEILASMCTKISESDLSLSKKWNQYVQVLKRKGYFRDLIEQSKEYVELENKARMYFLDNVGVEESSKNNILSILQTVKCSIEEMKEEETQLPPSDDETWMEVTEDQFNKLLEDRFGLKSIDATNSPNAFSSAINKFLNQMSDVEGIENDALSSRKIEMDVDEEENADVSFDPGNFMASVQQIIKELSEGKDVSRTSNGDSEDDDDDFSSENGSDDDAPEDPDMKSYMDLMDSEVRNSTLSKSFTNQSQEDAMDPVNIDMDAMANILKSYEEQFGGSGPAGNLLHSMGLKVKVKKTT